jgi:hypothetical protein
MRAFAASLKTGKPCADCGIQYPPYVMQYDHVRGKKEFVISSQVSRGQVSMSRLLSEIEKCDLVCANCHAIRTFTRRRPC